MASLYVVAIKDRALDAFMRPFFVAHNNQAIRSFIDEANRTDSEIHKHPEDYDLYSLGTFNEETGHFDATPPQLLLRAQDATNRKG